MPNSNDCLARTLLLLLLWFLCLLAGGLPGFFLPGITRTYAYFISSLSGSLCIVIFCSFSGDLARYLPQFRIRICRLFNLTCWLTFSVSTFLILQHLFREPEPAYLIPKTTAEFLFMLIVGVLLGPLAEELLFRGLIIDSLNELFKRPLLSIILSALIFTITHPYSLRQLLVVFYLGYLLGYFRIRKGLGYCLAAHATVNLTGIIYNYFFL
ncbi:MAG: CPBP family intramembrane metalloprotease [Candidatus Wallbacteria bacterium]|nr:CPBP family intramembrane metalloprotease [Candidatus Wallbacteria bacterium]